MTKIETLTSQIQHDIINMLHKRQKTIDKKVEPKEEQRGCLCSNSVNGRCSSLGFNPNSIPEDVALDYLASILVEIFLEQKEHE